jgi:hypothetical protein
VDLLLLADWPAHKTAEGDPTTSCSAKEKRRRTTAIDAPFQWVVRYTISHKFSCPATKGSGTHSKGNTAETQKRSSYKFISTVRFWCLRG